MHVLFLMVGTHGDMVIGIPVAKALEQMGIQVSLMVAENFAEECEKQGIAYHTIPINIRQIVTQAAALIDSSESLLKLISEARKIVTAEVIEGAVVAVRDTLNELKPDLIVSHDWARFFFSPAIDESGIPHGSLSPNITADSNIPLAPSILPPVANRWPGWAIRASHHVVGAFLALALTARSRSVLAKLDGKPFNFLHTLATPSWFGRYSARERFSLYTMNPIFLQGRHITAPHVAFTGYSSLADEAMAPDLMDKLKSDGPPWWAFSFGSLGANADRMTRIILDAAHRTGRRALIIGGWGGLRLPDDIDLEHVLFVEYAPYEQISPLLEGFIIHGGSGAIHTVIPHGTPIGVVAFFPDQRWFADLVGRIGGIKIPVISNSKFNADWLVDVIGWAQKPDTRQAMQSIGTQFNQTAPHDPARMAAEIILKAVAK